MRGFALCLLATGVAAQGITLSDVSYSYTATFTVTAWETITTTTCPCTFSTTSSVPVLSNDPALTYSTPTTTVPASSGTPSTTTSLTPLIPDGTITPSFTSTSDTVPPNSSTGPSGGILTLSTSTSAGSEPSVTNSAYINAILRHHNIHRTNHSANALAWSSSLAETARVIAQTCIYQHVTNVGGGGYGQNIGAGYTADAFSMGKFVTEGLYNSEVNFYTAYGSEPVISDYTLWGHFTQVVWKSTDSIGCYTADCTSTGLANATGIPPFFTVCNYAPPGNFAGFFNVNIGSSIGLGTVYADY